MVSEPHTLPVSLPFRLSVLTSFAEESGNADGRSGGNADGAKGSDGAKGGDKTNGNEGGENDG